MRKCFRTITFVKPFVPGVRYQKICIATVGGGGGICSVLLICYSSPVSDYLYSVVRGNRLSIKLARGLAQILRDKYPPMFPPVPGTIFNLTAVLWTRIRIGSVFNGVPGSVSWSGFWRAKITHNNRKELINFIFGVLGVLFLRAEGFSCNLNVFYGGLGISNFWK